LRVEKELVEKRKYGTKTLIVSEAKRRSSYGKL
jgi:hypothetical protein